LVFKQFFEFQILTVSNFRRLMILEDQYKQALNELTEKQENLKQVRPATAKVKKDTQLAKVLENQLDKNLKSYNNL